MASAGLRANRNFLLLWSGHAFSKLGFHGVRIAYPLLVLTLTDSPAAAGWVGFAIAAPSLIFQIPAGIVADYGDRIRILVRCQLVGLAATGLVASAIYARLPGLVVIAVAAAFVEGCVSVFVDVSELAAVRDVVAPEHRPAAFSFLEAEQPIASLFGRAAGAAVYGVARWLPFVANAVSYLVCLITLMLIRQVSGTPSAADRPTRHSTARSIADGLRTVWSDRFLRASTAMIAASNAVIQVVLLLIMVELAGSGYSAWIIGLVLGSAGLGGILGAAGATRLIARFPIRLVYRAALWVWTALLVPIALSTNPFVFAACWAGIGGIGVVSNVALTVYRVEVIPEQILGRAVAAMGLFWNAAVALGALGAGYLLSTLGIMVTRWAALAAMLALAICAGTSIVAHRSATPAPVSAR
ncbi:MFS transporter [Nocardia sp. NPDC051990]|uniref:MFS transporter n=1 Tax=Nocardia sp. NPDC051990 TaxID=3155285 RepID=UPI00343074E4